VHTGRLYGREQQVSAFLAALAALPSEVKVLFVGVDESRIMPEARRLGLESRVWVEPFVPHARSLGYQRAADALLLVNGRRPESMSSKVFEYLDAARPVFAISPAGSAARVLFAEVGGGMCVLPDSDMAGPLAGFIESVRLGRASVAEGSALERYDLVRLTAELSMLLDRLAADPDLASRRGRGWRFTRGPHGRMQA
ncbi:MAG TPA: glycosyltransferase, partial [Thermoleophilia bacterium]|nr:glycosyltransferase [Thermoleophilia bacterium]